jgi:Zn-finger nucleic acid-binding protein
MGNHMPRGAFHCPTCGAAASGDAKSCNYCSARLATVQCAKCFGTMFEGSRFCQHCGALGAQRRLRDEAQLTCPRCRTPEAPKDPLMEPAELHDIHLDECGRCGGVWMDHGTFRRVCADAEAQADTLSMLTVMRGSAERDVVRYLRCPLCDKLMDRRNYASRSGVIIDVCPGHGMWMDHDELRRIVEFIRSGGMEEARQADADHAKARAARKASEEFWLGKAGWDAEDRSGTGALKLFEMVMKRMFG